MSAGRDPGLGRRPRHGDESVVGHRAHQTYDQAAGRRIDRLDVAVIDAQHAPDAVEVQDGLAVGRQRRPQKHLVLHDGEAPLDEARCHEPGIDGDGSIGRAAPLHDDATATDDDRGTSDRRDPAQRATRPELRTAGDRLDRDRERRRPERRILVEQCEHGAIDHRRQIVASRRRRLRRIVDVMQRELERVAGERRRAGDHVIGERTERIEVGAGVDVAPAALLR